MFPDPVGCGFPSLPLLLCDQKPLLGFGILLAQIQQHILPSYVVPDRVLSFFLMSFEWVVEGLLLSIVAVVRTQSTSSSSSLARP